MTFRMTIGQKLIASFAAMLCATVVLGIASLTAIRKLTSSLETAVNRTTRKIDLIDSVSNSRSDMLAAQRGFIMFGYAKNPAGEAKAKTLFETAAANWAQKLSEVRPLLVTDEGRRMAEQLEMGLPQWRAAFAEMQGLTASGDCDSAVRIAVDKGVPIYEAVGRQAERLREINNGILEKDREAAAHVESISQAINFGLVGLSLAVGGVVLWLVRDISLTLRRLAGDMAEGADQVARAAAQVASSSQSLAQGSSEQAASLEETSASSEEINSMARKNSGELARRRRSW